MKRFLTLMLPLILVFTQATAQDTIVEKIGKPDINYLDNAMVVYADSTIASLTYNGRFYAVNNRQTKFVEGRKYFVIVRIWDCDSCSVIKAIVEYHNTSVEQTKIDINLSKYYMRQKLKKYEED